MLESTMEPEEADRVLEEEAMGAAEGERRRLGLPGGGGLGV